MKKNILILSLLIPFWSYSQNTNTNHLKKQPHQASVEVSSKSTSTSIESKSAPSITTQGNTKTLPSNVQVSSKRNASTYSFIELGSTYYDLQTNASMGRRIQLLPDGKVSAVWTTSSDEAFATRGTGYNHYNGTGWFNPTPSATPRIENTRLGWPSIGINGTKEWTMAHSAADGGFVQSENASVGSNSWTSKPLVLSQPLKRPIWGRVVNSGNYFHCIASYADSSQLGEPRAPFINGVYAPMVYSRSTNGGNNWEVYGSITNEGQSYIDGLYTNIPIKNNGAKKNGIANFKVINGKINDFQLNGDNSLYNNNDQITLYNSSNNVISKVNLTNDTLKHKKQSNLILSGSKVIGKNKNGFYNNCVVNNIINDSMLTVTNKPLYGKLTKGSGYKNGNYQNIKLNNSTNNNLDYFANFTVSANSINNFKIINSNDIVNPISFSLTSKHVSTSFIDSLNDTLIITNPVKNVIKGSNVVLKSDTNNVNNVLISEVVNDSTFVLSKRFKYMGNDSLEIIPPYGDGNIFEYDINYYNTLDTLNINVPYGNGNSFEFLFSNYKTFNGYNGDRVISGGGDVYSIDVRDSIVAIITGKALHDVMVFKSTDNGETFNLIIADSFKYAPYDAKKLMTDTPFVCDGSVDVLIDNNGNVHAFWGVTRVLDTDTTDESYSFFPGTTLLGYWNEINNQSTVIAGGSQFDRDGNGELNISAGNFNALDANGQVPQTLIQNNITSVGRLGNTAMLHMPSAGLDNNGNIYVTFSLPLEQDVDINNLNLRDIMLVHSTDGGNTWSKPQDITQKQGQEEEFACIARTANDFVHIVFQMDALAGTNLQNNSTRDNNHPVALNKIMYVAVPTAKILDGSIGQLWNSNVKSFNANKEVFIVSQNQPNPFSNESEVIIWLDNESDVTLEITNISGQVIKSTKFNQLNAGNHSLTIDGNGLNSGIYFYTVKTATHSVTKKMNIQ